MPSHPEPTSRGCDPVADAATRVLRTQDLRGWRVGDHDGTSFWVHYLPPEVTPAIAGRKLHVSASLGDAPLALDRCIPLLVQARVPFKHAATSTNLSLLSAGHGGPTQVGKFLTAYPPDETMSRLLAERLHQATQGLSGPRIPGELPYSEGSCVYSRFGAFTPGWIQLPTGRVVPAVLTEAGWVPDQRGADPHDDREPGGAAGLDHRGEPVRPVRLGPFVALRRLSDSPRGRTWLAAGPDRAEMVVVKERLQHTTEDLSGHDSVSRLRSEAEALVRLDGLDIAPTYVDFWEQDEAAYLAYLPWEGPSGGAVMADLAARGLRPPAALLENWARSLLDVTERLHRAGLVAADIKPRNLVVMPQGLRLIDLELAGPPTSEPTGGAGTPGYCSPQQADPARGRAMSDDVYAVGATLLALAVSQEAAALPDLAIVAGLEHERDPGNPVYPLVRACLEPDEADRPATIAEADRHLSRCEPPTDDAALPDPLGVAAQIGERLLATARRPGDRYACWASNHSTAGGQVCRDIYIGSAGVALFLAELFEATGTTEFLEGAVQCGNWLVECPSTIHRVGAMPGLYLGDAGPAALYLRLGTLTGQRRWFELSREFADGVDPGSVASPDLMTGLAGLGLFHLMRWNATGNADAIRAAVGCADELGRRRSPNRPTWPFPQDFDLLAEREYAGFSHGTAGVGYFLSRLAMVADDRRWSSWCRDAADWVLSEARDGLADRSGLRWGAIGKDVSFGLNWCHGSPGVLRFLLAAHEALGDASYLDAARRAGRMVAWGGAWVGTTQCHGLAGNVEALLDLWQRTGEPEELADAERLARNLLAYETPRGWLGENATWCPDLMVGEAGVGAAFRRLAAPGRPHLLAPSAFTSLR